MSEETRVIQTTTGHAYMFSVEQEIRKESGTKYPDKIVVKAMLSGHDTSYLGVLNQLLEAQKDIRNTLKQFKEENNVDEGSNRKLEETKPTS